MRGKKFKNKKNAPRRRQNLSMPWPSLMRRRQKHFYIFGIEGVVGFHCILGTALKEDAVYPHAAENGIFSFLGCNRDKSSFSSPLSKTSL